MLRLGAFYSLFPCCEAEATKGVGPVPTPSSRQLPLPPASVRDWYDKCLNVAKCVAMLLQEYNNGANCWISLHANNITNSFHGVESFTKSEVTNRILWNPKVLYRFRKISLLTPVLRQTNPIYDLRLILILSSHLRLSFPSDSFLLQISTPTFYTFSSPRTCYMARPSHLPSFFRPHYIWWEVQIVKLLVLQFLFILLLIPVRTKFLARPS